MGQYRTKRLTVTKSYLRYKARRYPVSEIATVEQPRINLELILVSLGMLGATVIFLQANTWLLLGFGASLLGGFVPPNKLKLTTRSGEEIHLNLTQERSPHRAMNTIRANVAEYQQKVQFAAAYAPPSSQMRLNPEEQIRQYVLQLLTIKFGYSQADIGYEFPLQMGSTQKRADVVVFSAGARHTQDNIRIIVECKRYDVGNDLAALEQLKSYMTVCINARFGIVASYRWLVIEKTQLAGRYEYRTIPVLVHASGSPLSITYAPGQPVEPNLPEIDEKDDLDDFIEDQVIGEEFVSPIPRVARLILRYAALLTVGCFVFTMIMITASPAAVPSGNVPLAERTWVTFTPSASPSPTPRMSETAFPSATLPLPTETPLIISVPVVESSSTPTLTPLPLPALPPTLIIPTAVDTPIANETFGVIQAARNVNLRMSPTTRGIVIMSVTPGTRVTILGANDDGSWLHVRIDTSHAVGWIAASLIRIEE